MPKKTDSEVIEETKHLYLNGNSYKQIGKKLSIKPATVNKWITKYNWSVKKKLGKVNINLDKYKVFKEGLIDDFDMGELISDSDSDLLNSLVESIDDFDINEIIN
jgi:hypothetical protein